MACKFATIRRIPLLLALFTVMPLYFDVLLSVKKAHPQNVASTLEAAMDDFLLRNLKTEPPWKAAIPHKLIFLDTRYTSPNELPKHFYDNIMRTASHYREAWHKPNAPIWFLGDKECRQAINATEPRLLPFYDKEKTGQHLANVCRIAALYLSGGYYFDTDMQSVKAVELEPDTVFSTVTEYGGKGLFNSFVASVPKHPVLKKALQIMLAYYHKKAKIRSGSHMGTSTLKDAFEAVPEAEHGKTFLMDEIHLDKDPHYRNFPRHNGIGCCCHNAVEDKSKKQIHFYSRIVGAGKNCDFPKGDPRRQAKTLVRKRQSHATKSRVKVSKSKLLGVSKAPSNSKKCSAAVILFGIPKSFSLIWEAYRKHIIEVNPHVDFTIYMHLYSDVRKLTNTKNSEVEVEIENEESIRKTFLDTRVVIRTSKQADYDETLQWITEKHTATFDPCCWTVETIKNMLRQGNSLKQAYQSAASNEHDVYVFARSDTFLATPVSISCLMPTNEIQMPSWQVNPKSEHNDRFAICGKEAAKVYGEKEEALRKYISGTGQNWNSEHLLWRFLGENNGMVSVKVSPNNWAQLLRIRGNDDINSRDAGTFREAAKLFQKAVEVRDLPAVNVPNKVDENNTEIAIETSQSPILYFVITTSWNATDGSGELNPNKRQAQYERGIASVLQACQKGFPMPHKVVVVENNGKRSTFLDQIEGISVLYTNNNWNRSESKGIKELQDVKDAIQFFGMRNQDLLVKMTGRNYLHPQSPFIDKLRKLDLDKTRAIVKFGSPFRRRSNEHTEDCSTALIMLPVDAVRAIKPAWNIEPQWARAALQLPESQVEAVQGKLGVFAAPGHSKYKLT